MAIDPIQGKPEIPAEWQSNQRLGTDKQAAAGRSQAPDDVQFSGPTQEFIRVRKLVDAVPDIRENRVEKLSHEIKLGTYNVSASDIADAIVRQHSLDLTDV